MLGVGTRSNADDKFAVDDKGKVFSQAYGGWALSRGMSLGASVHSPGNERSLQRWRLQRHDVGASLHIQLQTQVSESIHPTDLELNSDGVDF